MEEPSYSALSRFIQTLGSTKAGAWFFAKVLHHVDGYIYRFSNERITLTALLTGLPVVTLTSTGARTGLPRSTHLLFARDADNSEKFAVIASNFGQSHYPSWYYNLKANPEAVANIQGKSYSVISYEADGEEYEHYWQIFVNVYKGYPEYQKRVTNRHIPIMVLSKTDS